MTLAEHAALIAGKLATCPKGSLATLDIAFGLNLAFVAWDQFRQKLGYYRKAASEVMLSLETSIKDAVVRQLPIYSWIQASLSFCGTIFRLWLYAIYCSAWLALILSFILIYAEISCRHIYILALPPLLHFFSTLIGLLVLRLAAFVARLAFNIPAERQITDDIAQLEKKISNLDSPALVPSNRRTRRNSPAKKKTKP